MTAFPRMICLGVCLLLAASSAAQTYTLSITATNGRVYRSPDAESYDPDTVVRVVAQPGQGYRFTGWTGDVPAGQRADEAKLDVTMTANKSLTANFAVWVPPIGVPEPAFGIWDTYRGYDVGGATAVNGRHIEYTRNPSLTYQASAGGGFFTHYIDNTDPAATDTANPYGSIAKPRLTLPANGTLPAGSIIEIHGGPYAPSERHWNGIGTVTTDGDAPIFIRGPSLTAMPEIQTPVVFGYYTYKDARWIIMENIRIHPPPGNYGGIGVVSYSESRNVIIRQCQIEGHTDTGAHKQATSFSNATSSLPTALSHDHVLYGNYIHTWGDWTITSGDPDNQGCSIGTGHQNGASGVPLEGQDKHTYNIWCVDNLFTHCTGDGIQANANVAQPYQDRMHHIYIARNHGWENKQPAFWVKAGVDIVFSQNHAWGAGQSSTSMGGCMGAQYGACRVWFLYNICHSDKFGIRYATDDQWGIYPEYNALDNYLIGNVIYDIHRRPGYPDGSDGWQEGGAFMLQQETSTRSFFLNTVYDCDSAFVLARRGVVIAENNLFGNIADNFYVCNFPDPLGATYLLNNIVSADADVYWGGTTARSLTEMETLAPGHWTGTVLDDPEFVDAANANFGLAGTSPAIDAAVLTGYTRDALDLFQSLYGLNIDVDAAGHLRDTSYDLGAYEYNPGTPPGPPSNPTPVDTTTDVPNNLTLQWGPGAYAVYYQVTLDTSNPPTAVLSSYCAPNHTSSGALTPGTTYYWQVTAYNGAGSAAGAVWSFTTETPMSLPQAVSNPNPADNATGIALAPTLSWSAATDAETYTVYLDTSNPPTTILSADQTGLTCPAGTLVANTTYYWKVVPKNDAGSGPATVYSFQTAGAPRYTLFRRTP